MLRSNRLTLALDPSPFLIPALAKLAKARELTEVLAVIEETPTDLLPALLSEVVSKPAKFDRVVVAGLRGKIGA